MTEEMQMLRLAAIIDNSQRACADGYSKPIGYTGTVGYTSPVGYTAPVGTGYIAPIGDLSTKSDEEIAMEAAYKADQDAKEGGSSGGSNSNPTNINVISNSSSNGGWIDAIKEAFDKSIPHNTGVVYPLPHSQSPTQVIQPEKKSVLDKIKERPVLWGLIAALLAVITFGVYKAKKG